MQQSIQCNFARCAIEHFTTKYKTSQHKLPKGSITKILHDYNQHLLHLKNFFLSPRSLARNGSPIELRKSFSLHFHQVGGQALTLRRNPNIPYKNAKYAKVSTSPTATPSPFPVAQKRHPNQFKYLSAL